MPTLGKAVSLPADTVDEAGKTVIGVFLGMLHASLIQAHAEKNDASQGDQRPKAADKPRDQRNHASDQEQGPQTGRDGEESNKQASKEMEGSAQETGHEREHAPVQTDEQTEGEKEELEHGSNPPFIRYQ